MDLEKPEKVMILTVIGVLILSSVNSLSRLSNPITREEAIEISKKSELVKEGMATHGYFGIGDIGYYNSSWVEQMKKGHAREIYEKVPDGHGIWKVTWTFTLGEGLMVGYTVIVIVDAETGAIIHETKGVGFG